MSGTDRQDHAVDTADVSSSEEDAADNDHRGRTNKLLFFMHTTKVKDGATHKSLWQMTKETLHMVDGKTSSSDIMAATMDEAMGQFKNLIAQAKSQEKKNPEKWDLPYAPLALINATTDDVAVAFLKWGRLIDDADDSADATTMNVSKAFRRFTTYVQWMHDNQDTLKEFVNTDDIIPAAKAFAMKMTHDDKGRLIWWVDMNVMDWGAIKSKRVSVLESIRYFVWLVHLVMLDTQAQDNGLVFVQDCKQFSFWKAMTSFPLDVGSQLDRLTIGVMPIKMKALYILNAGTGLHVSLKIMKAFTTKKLRQRFMVIDGDEKSLQQQFTAIVGGPSYIPCSFPGMGGTVEEDIVFGTNINLPPWISEENAKPAARMDAPEV